MDGTKLKENASRPKAMNDEWKKTAEPALAAEAIAWLERARRTRRKIGFTMPAARVTGRPTGRLTRSDGWKRSALPGLRPKALATGRTSSHHRGGASQPTFLRAARHSDSYIRLNAEILSKCVAVRGLGDHEYARIAGQSETDDPSINQTMPLAHD